MVLLSETGFSFNGVHSRRDMGLIYVEKDGHIAIPEIKRNSYSIAGMSGTLLLSGEVWQPFTLEGTLVPADEPATQAQAQALLRRILSWLTAGRKQLIFDYEPGIYYLAELAGTSKWSLKNWFGGELAIKFLVQPTAYSVMANTATLNIGGSASTASLGGSLRTLARSATPVDMNGGAAIHLKVDTDQPTGLTLTVENTGTAPIASVKVTLPQAKLSGLWPDATAQIEDLRRGTVVEGIQIDGLELATGQRLTIDTNPPASVTIDGENAMAHVTAFTPVRLGDGVNILTVRLDYGDGGDRSARVTASARGRW